MEKSPLMALTHQKLTVARHASSGHSSHTVHGGHEHVPRHTSPGNGVGVHQGVPFFLWCGRPSGAGLLAVQAVQRTVTAATARILQDELSGEP